MKMNTMHLFLVLVLGVLATGCLSPGQTWATSHELPELSLSNTEVNWDDLVFEQLDGTSDGSDGDPDSTNDGLNVLGTELLNGCGFDEITMNAMLKVLMVQLIPVP